MQVSWLDPEHPDTRDLAGAAAVLEAARLVDAPHQRERSTSALVADLRHGWDGDPAAVAVARDGSGRVVAVLELDLPTYDNTHLGFFIATVDPVARRRGMGGALLDVALNRTRDEGRRLMLTEAWEGSAGVGFLEQLGFDRASDAVQRRQELRTLDHDDLDRTFADALAHAAGYELVRVPTSVPEALLADVVTMTAAINDAPIDGLDIEDEVFTPARIRAFETAQLAHRRRIYRVVARERTTGTLAGHTLVAVDAERPWDGLQYDTSVLRAHRGHRLGVLLKVAMLHWLADEEPQVHSLDTWNAASNVHMIEVNETLGYHVVAPAAEWQRKL